MGSVLAVADANGNVIERVWYDPFGQPSIELKDTLAPVIQSIAESPDGNSLLIALSESVWAPANDPGPGGGIVLWPSLSTNLLTISDNSSNFAGSVQLLPSLPGYPPYSVLQYSLQTALPETNSIVLTLNSNVFSDEWGNTNACPKDFLPRPPTIQELFFTRLSRFRIRRR